LFTWQQLLPPVGVVRTRAARYRWGMPKLTVPSLLVALLVSACGFPKTTERPPALTEADLATNREALALGGTTFAAKCNGCHGYPDVASVPADRWPAIVKEMAGKASLTPAQESATLAFVLAAQKPH